MANNSKNLPAINEARLVEDMIRKPTEDLLFKRLFGCNEGKHRTIALLNALLADELKHKIQKLDFLPTESIADQSERKTCRLDVLCELDSGETVNIEMQKRDEHNIAKRSLYYWARTYVDKLDSGQDYNKLVPVISINILDFEISKRRKSYFHFVKAFFKSPLEEFLNDDFRLCFIELPKIRIHKRMTDRDKWVMFLNPRIPFHKKEEMAMNDAAMSDAVECCKKFSPEYIERWKRTQLDFADHDRASALAFARSEGAKEKAQENAIALMKNGATLELIMKSLGFSKKVLLKLAKQNNITVTQ